MNATAIGANAIVNASNKVRLGSAAVTVVEGPVGYTVASDGRFKDDLRTDVKGLDFIMKLRPLTYYFNYTRMDNFTRGDDLSLNSQELKQNKTNLDNYHRALNERSHLRETGFVAQEVERAAKESGYTAFNGVHAPTSAKDNYSLDYSKLVVPLVKAVQEQQALIEKLNKKIYEQEKANEELRKRLEKLEKEK